MKIEEVIGEVSTIGISGHVRPDGDCIGSCMGMYLYLKKIYPNARIDVFLEKIPEVYNYIPGVETIRDDFVTDVEQYDAFLILDTGKDRTLGAEKYYDNAKKRINIDHHKSNPGIGDWKYIYPMASSACELAYELMDPSRIDKEIAMTLYTGMISDTGVFKYSNTSPKTLQIASKLISYGFAFDELIDRVFFEKTYKQNLLLGRALLESELLCEGHLIVSFLTIQMIEEYGASHNDVEGIVSQLQLTKGVDCSVFIHQDGENEYKISLRSNGKVDVSKVAQQFGGGGHARAAGISMTGDGCAIKKELVDTISVLLQ
ncbi:DHH family phosphoesterase [Butyrivibrio sp. NC3005]|uniref:DHH family phosphoesterase n=1 Tax=Butyrivibrio sp. NC3005 TaxID=1280685 RepID=UPI0003F8ECF1|nr:bifunctional oligoribonuclease/PAP phosphatase NrnA [Butyrivibrio sp. NC3005]